MDAGFSLVWPDGQDPWRAENVLGVTSALLLALAWTVVVSTSRWSRTTRLLAAVPALLTGAAALTTFVLRGGRRRRVRVRLAADRGERRRASSRSSRSGSGRSPTAGP